MIRPGRRGAPTDTRMPTWRYPMIPQRHLGDDVVSVLHADGFEHPLIVGVAKGGVAHARAAEHDAFDIPVGKVILQIHRAQHGESGPQGVPVTWMRRTLLLTIS